MCDPRTAGYQPRPTTYTAQRHTARASVFQPLWVAGFAQLWPNGASWNGETLWAFSMPILFMAPCQNVLGQGLLFPLFLDGNVTPPFLSCTFSTSAPNSHMASQISQRIERYWPEGKQRVRDEPVGLAVWEGQSSTWGAFSGRQRGPLNWASEGRPSVCCWDAQAPKARKAAKWHGIEKSSVCKYIPCLSHIYLLRAKINHGYLWPVHTRFGISKPS